MWKRRHATDSSASPARPAASSTLEASIQEIGQQLLSAMDAHEAGFLDKAYWSSKLMEWATQDQTFKGRLFQLVDVFPVLTDSQAVAQHLEEYLRTPGLQLPAGMAASLKAGSFLPGAMAKALAGQIEQMARQFIAGRSVEEALPNLRQRWDSGIAFSLDLLGEACLSAAEADAYQQRYLALIQEMAAAARDWPGNDLLDRDHLGPIPRVNVSVKVSSLTAKFDPAAPEPSIERVMKRLGPLLETAGKHGVFINFDMEQHAYKDLTLDLFMQACETHDFLAGIALQAYLQTGEADAQKLIDWTKRTGRQITVRLVKGAYWDYELAHAQARGWAVPVWHHKSATDACFERMARQLITACPREADQPGVKLALGSHNVRSVAAAVAMLEQAGLPKSAIELQMLRGMADAFKAAAAQQQLRVREYVPVSELIPGMAYLVRRLLENTSNQSWLLSRSRDAADAQALLAPPVMEGEDASQRMVREITSPSFHALSELPTGDVDPSPFVNEPLRDFSDASQREAFTRAIHHTKLEKVAITQSLEDAEKALEIAAGAYEEWSRTSVAERAEFLIKTAALMREKRDALAGLIIRESAKPWREADADVCEAIDFLEYYAGQARVLFEERRLGRFINEHNQVITRPRGPAVIISPWNFPLAICMGMTAAALVTGNPAIVKPAEQSPAIAKVMVDLLHQAGVPKPVVTFLPGEGHSVGAALVRDPRVAIIAFTGSRQVGVELMRVAASFETGQHQPKRLICEMGGKNAIIVDRSADPDLAVQAVRESAFGYAGQKCSACSRVIVVGQGHDHFVHRLIEATRALVIGDPLDPDTDLGPVIDEEAAANIRKYIQIGRGEAHLAYAGDIPAGLVEKTGRAYIGPHVFTNVLPGHRIAQEEIFGPVLSVMQAKNFEDALRIANASDYKLTGAVISRTPSHLEKARREFAVGNLYLNRGCTGALVARQPFGGFGMSGIGHKAGGVDYLRQFVDQTICTENTLRSGFSPEMFELLREPHIQKLK